MSINFCVASGGLYKTICNAIMQPVIDYLPEVTVNSKLIPGAVNIGLFITDEGCQAFIPHGIADKNYRNADKVRGFQYVFVSGPAWVEKLTAQGFPRSKIMIGGYTKLDPIFQGKYVKRPHDRPLILYAPTHGAIESISLDGRFDECLSQLSQHYEVIHAPHPATNPGANVTMQALVNADVVISDAGSLVYEAWALGKPVVFPSWLLKDGVIKHFPGSFEEQVYREEIGYHAWNVTSLLDCVKCAALKGLDRKAIDFIESIFPSELRGRSGGATAKLLMDIAKTRDL